MAFQKGHKPWNKGIKGLHLSPNTEFKKGEKLGKLNHRYKPESHNVCVSCGIDVWRKSKRCKQCFIKYKFQNEENHPRWQGNEVNYRSLHKWVQKHLGKPHKCDFCSRTDLPHRHYHWANKSRKYLRLIEDWVRLCAKCHKNYDKQAVNQF